MMHSMVALAIVGVLLGRDRLRPRVWRSDHSHVGGSLLGFSSDLLFLHGIKPDTMLPGTNIPVYVHVMYQGMFAIITPALISGAIAERIRFGPYCLFIASVGDVRLLPAGALGLGGRLELANTLSAVPNATLLEASGKNAVGWLGEMEALDFAGGTVVHIAAGLSGLAAILVLRKRIGYPEHAMHPNSMVLTLTRRRPAVVRLVRLQRRQRRRKRNAGGVGVRGHAGWRRPRRG